VRTRKKMKEKMKGGRRRRYARVLQFRIPVFNIYMYIYYLDGVGWVSDFFYNQDLESAPPCTNPPYFGQHPLKTP